MVTNNHATVAVMDQAAHLAGNPLWARIARHDFAPPQPLNFTLRLARDHRWKLPFAQAAIAEYRRFCYLAVTAPHPVTPSEEVDEVWHLHLTYTHDYWDIWCAQVLGRPLHHEPTQGGASEQARFAEQYARTLRAYEATFGPRPETFWPGTAERFARPHFRLLDARRFWSIPRP